MKRGLALLLPLLVLGAPHRAAHGECRIAHVDFTPEPHLQIAVWIEDTAGNYVTTLYVTAAVGTYGIGNRPGRYDLNSGLYFIYGRREHALPVWAHHRGVTYPRLVFHDGNDGMLSHAANVSSDDPYFCTPLAGADIDLITCPSPNSTDSDKGVEDPGGVSYYPPRNDVVALRDPTSGEIVFDDPIVDLFASLNDLDAVSRATPPGGVPYQVEGVLDASLADGDYVLFVEVSREFDFNDSYNPITHPAAGGSGVQSGYGDPARGQPSVVWKLPFTLGGAELEFQTADYAGYGELDGASGGLNPPDGTINTVAGTYPYDQDGIGPRATINYPSLGQARLQLLVDGAGGTPYRVRLAVEPYDDSVAPNAPPMVGVREVGASEAALYFTAPGDDGAVGKARGYEIRLSAAAPLTQDNFTTGKLVAEGLPSMPAGATIPFELDALLPQTTYYVGVRGFDECLSPGPVTLFSFTTLAAKGGEVDACFVATAAWGSLFESHVQPLRALRDRALRTNIFGELAVEAYYTFGPALAELIEPSAELRALARFGLAPLVGVARVTMDTWSEGTE